MCKNKKNKKMDKEFIINLSLIIAYVVIYIPLYFIHTAYYDYQVMILYLLSGMLAGFCLMNIIRYHKDEKKKDKDINTI